MTRKIWLLLGLAVLLAAGSLYLNREWFAKDIPQIYHRSRPLRAVSTRRKRDDSAVDPITFGFDRRLKLTSIKVFLLNDVKTNKYPYPIWHLVSDSNSVPTKAFGYGAPIKGMHPAVKGATPQPLEPGTSYQLVVEAPNFKGTHDFVPVAKTP
jgi:hypothetical protein